MFIVNTFRGFYLSVATMLVLLPVPAVADMSKPPKAKTGSLPLGSAEGTITINGQMGSLKFAYAKSDMDNDGKNITVILLTDKPVPAKIIESLFDIPDWAEKTGAHVVTLFVRADKSLGTVDVFHERIKYNDVVSEGENFELMLEPVAGARVAGRARTTRPGGWMDDKWTFDVRFNAPLGEGGYGENPIATKELAAEKARRSSNLAQGVAKGTFVVDGKTVNLKHAYARMQKDPFDEKKKEIVVILSDQPLGPDVVRGGDLGALSERLGRLTDQGKFQGLLMKADDSEHPNYVAFYHPLLGARALTGGGSLFSYDSIRSNDKTVEGRLFTEKVDDFFFAPHKYSYDVTFHARVEPLGEEVKSEVSEPPAIDAKSGRKLPKGGGEPGKAFMAYLKSVEQGKSGEMVRFFSEEALAATPEFLNENGELAMNILEVMRGIQGKKVKITDGYISGDRATLYVKGVSSDTGKPVKGTMTMVRQKGTWRIAREKWD